MKYQNLLFYIIVSFGPILGLWSHNSYKWLSKKFCCYYVKKCYLKNKITVTWNSLAKRSSFRESAFVLTQANYLKLQQLNENETKGWF